MKKYVVLSLLICAILAFSLSAFAVPQLINYQGKLTDSAGTPITGTKSVSFSIYNTSTGGTSLWSETQTVNLTNGIFNATLGSVNPIPPSVFLSDDSYLGITVDADSEMTPRQRITSDGYSYKSGTADAASDIFSLDASKLTGTVSDALLPSDVAKLNVGQTFSGTQAGTFSGTFIGDGSGLTNIPAPASLNASNLTGTVPDGSLSANVPLLNASQTFTGANTFSANGSSPAVNVYTTGTGNAVFGNMSGASGSSGYFKISNHSNNCAALYGTTNGGGASVMGYTLGVGQAGYFQISNA
ncbi:MAG: hypothetical protein WA666_13170, partial [Nitrospirota bacterium]